MNVFRATFLLFALVLAGCGGDNMMTCDEGPYQEAVRAPKVVAPEGLDDLDPLNERPLPQASPQEQVVEEGRCLESPPSVIRTN